MQHSLSPLRSFAQGTGRSVLLCWLMCSFVGLVFATQLRLHYDVPWSLSIYWGLTDWYLWGALSLSLWFVVRDAAARGMAESTLAGCLLLLGPLVICLHVTLTMLCGYWVEPGFPDGVLNHFARLFAKKLTINTITYLIVTGVVLYLLTARSEKEVHFRGRQYDRVKTIRPYEISFVKSAGNYVDVATSSGIWSVRDSLRNVEAELDAHGFLRISRFVLVRRDKIRECRSRNGALQLTLQDGSVLSVAKRFKAQVRRALDDR